MNSRIAALPHLHAFAQAAFDTHYLQPYPKLDRYRRVMGELIKDTAALRDGEIERAVHGAMHTGRASIVCEVIYHLFLQEFPAYTQVAMDNVASSLGIHVPQLLWLIRAAVIYHDSARLDEGRDFWDKQSAAKLQAALIQIGCPEDISQLIAAAAANKDARGLFTEYCREHHANIDPVHLDIIRKLIHLSDCFDSLRCRGDYSLHYVSEQLETIPGYSEESHFAPFIQLAQALHTVIWNQGDMLVDCKISHRDVLIPTEKSGARFLRKCKVKFEHAENVASALTADMQQHPYFQPHLKSEDCLSSAVSNVTPVFDGFIHGTQSGALAVLKCMHDRGQTPRLTSALDLIQHSLAPMTGELSRRGASRGLSDSAMMCFGRLRLSSNDHSGYTLDKIVQYAECDAGRFNTNAALQDKVIGDFQFTLDLCQQSGFTYLNSLMVYYIRAKQLGVADEALIADKMSILHRYQSTIAVYYLVLLLEKHIRLNREVIQSLSQHDKQNLMNKIDETLSMNYLAQLIENNKIDVKRIFNHPTAENLNPLLDLFRLPPASGLHNLNWLRVAMDTPPHCELKMDYAYDFNTLVQNRGGRGFSTLLVNYVSFSPDARAVVGVQPYIPEHIALMEQHALLLEKVLTTSYDNFLTDPLSHYLLTENFPVVFLSESEEAINIAQFSTQEYRADRALVFGEDVRLLATKDHEHAAMLRYFLDKNGFANVGVVLFSELSALTAESRRPTCLFQPQGSRLPNLAWLAARAVVPGTLQNRTGKSLLEKLQDKVTTTEAESDATKTREARREFIRARNTHKRVEDATMNLLTAADAYNKFEL